MIIALKKLIVASILAVLTSQSLGEHRQIQVSLDVFPPFTNNDGSGLSLQLFREIEKHSNLTFTFNFDHFDKIKLQLRRGKTDVIGHLTVTHEPHALKKFSQLLDIKIDFVADFYVTDLKKLDNLTSLKIGTIRGSRQVASSASGVPIEQFISFSDNENMLNNLIKGTIDAIYFERASIISSSKKLGLKGLYYQQHPKQTFQFSYATMNDAHGDSLKQELDIILREIDINTLFVDYDKYLNIPQQGLVEDYYEL